MELPKECWHNVHKFHCLTFCAWKSNLEGKQKLSARLSSSWTSEQSKLHSTLLYPLVLQVMRLLSVFVLAKTGIAHHKIQMKTAMSHFKILVRVWLLKMCRKICSHQQVMPLREKAFSCNVLYPKVSLNWAHTCIFWSRLASVVFLLSAGLSHSMTEPCVLGCLLPGESSHWLHEITK